MQTVLYWTFAVLNFLGEMALWAGVGRAVWRLSLPVHPTLAIVLGVTATGAVIFLWALFMAPNADRRLSVGARIALIALVSLATGYLLYRNQDRLYGLLLMIPLTIIMAIGQYYMQLHDAA